VYLSLHLISGLIIIIPLDEHGVSIRTEEEACVNSDESDKSIKHGQPRPQNPYLQILHSQVLILHHLSMKRED